MNAYFRRDYLYTIKKSLTSGLTEGTKLRYLKFDRSTKEYIFIEGVNKDNLEIQIRVKRANAQALIQRLGKVKWIGYQMTDQYLKPKRVEKHIGLLDIGEMYKFKVDDKSYYYINDTLNYEVKGFSNGLYHLKANTGGEYALPIRWLAENHVKIDYKLV